MEYPGTVWLHRTSDREGGEAPGAKGADMSHPGSLRDCGQDKKVSGMGCGMFSWEKDSENIKFLCLSLPYFHISI